jgi:hypothetical protein
MMDTHKALNDCQTDACFLHGMLQGLVVLIDDTPSNASPASNAAYALASELVAKASRLSDDLDRLESKARVFTGGLVRQQRTCHLCDWLWIPAPDFISATGTADIATTDFAAVAQQSDCSAVNVIHAAGIVTKVNDMFAAQSEALKV